VDKKSLFKTAPLINEHFSLDFDLEGEELEVRDGEKNR